MLGPTAHVAQEPGEKPPAQSSRRAATDVYDFIANALRRHGYPPSIREMGIQLGIRSTNGVADHLKALERKGYLSKAGRQSRTWQVHAQAPTSAPFADTEVVPQEGRNIPLLGRVAAPGEPILAEEQALGTLLVDEAWLGGLSPVFALQVVGDPNYSC